MWGRTYNFWGKRVFFLLIFIDSQPFGSLCFVLSTFFSFPFSQNEGIQVGSVFDSLENSKTLSIGGVEFRLPENLFELQQSLGGEGACVSIGFSNIVLKDG